MAGRDPDKAENGEPRSPSPELSDMSTATDHKHPPRPHTSFRIGQYQVLREMGEGGMGTVYLAMRADQEFKKYVAVKIIRKGMRSQEIVARFRRERQILASLDHPNIAKLLDGGSTDEGLPYYVMEYIQGRPLTEYCDNHKLNTKERLQLFRMICSAVQYAHQNLVVHRDLKPGNILVTAEGIPKLLDFGIAKLLNPDVFSEDSPPTATEIRVMTPEYASPEQIRGDPITTASDIYSLGVILYEILAGRRPYQFTSRNHIELYRVVCEQEPVRPSTGMTKKQEGNTERLSQLRGTTPERLEKELRGDLDNIALMAIRKESQRRYASAEALSEDIRRHLQGHPVRARKGTWSYRAGKYISRHKGGVIAATVIFMLLLGFAATTAVQNIRIAQQRDAAEKQKTRAEAEAQKSENVTRFLTDLFEINDPAQAKGKTITAREVLDKGAQRIRTELKEQPEVQAKLMNTLGTIYVKMGLYDDALPLLQDALKIRKHVFGPRHAAVAESLLNLGDLMWQTGEIKEAEKMLRESLNMRMELLGSKNLAVAESLNQLAYVLNYNGQHDEAEQLQRRSLAIRVELLGNEHPDVAQSLNSLGFVLHDQGKLDEAEKLHRQSLAIRRKVFGNEHPDVTESLINLAAVLQDKGELDQSENLTREALAIDRKLLGNDHPDVATDLNNLAALLHDQGKLDEAEEYYREALAAWRTQGNEYVNVPYGLNKLAYVLYDKGQMEEAERLHREALALWRKLYGNQHPGVANSLAGLGEILIAQGKLPGAMALLKEALAIPLDQLPEGHRFRARAESALGACYLARRKYSEAEPLLVGAYKVLSVQEKRNPATKRTLQRIIDLYRAWGKPEKAEAFQKASARL